MTGSIFVTGSIFPSIFSIQCTETASGMLIFIFKNVLASKYNKHKFV